MEIKESDILYALGHVDDPDLHKDLVTLKMIENIKIDDSKVSFDVVLTTPACPMKDMIRNACVNAVHHFVNQDLEVHPNMTSRVSTSRNDEAMLPGVKNIIVVASGKGGVGKSTVAVNLSRSLASQGAKVGILDADIYGPSLPTMFGLKDARPQMKDDKILPMTKDGLKIQSIGFLVDDKQAIIWRGPMASSAIKQLLTDVAWGELDYLILDLPPGTGDIHLTIAQSLPVSGAVVVTTPQEVALADCRKAIGMFNNDHLKTPVLGIIENMAYFVPPDMPDKKYFLFGEGGGKRLADEFGLPLLGEIPIVEQIMMEADQGEFDPSNSAIRSAYHNLASEVARQVSIHNSKKPAQSQSNGLPSFN